MSRQFLFIPKSELLKQFEENKRKDLKVVVPEILTESIRRILRVRGKDPKPNADIAEIILEGNVWSHSKENEPNKICESRDFTDYDTRYSPIGDFTISFAYPGSLEERHFHSRHIEIYYSEFGLGGIYRQKDDNNWKDIPDVMKSGGVIVFGAKVAHKMDIEGLTIIIEVPAVPGDRKSIVET